MKKFETDRRATDQTTLEEMTVLPAPSPAARRLPWAMVVAVCVATTAMCAVVVALPSQASAAVAWSAEVHQAPTNLPPGGRGSIWITPSNTGSTDATGWPTVSFALPPGVTVGTPAPPGDTWTCTGTSVVSCSFALGSFVPVRAYSYSVRSAATGVNPIRLTVDVAQNAPEGAFAFPVTLDGSGGAQVTKTHQLAVGTASLPFGVAPGTFEAGAFEESGNDYTQAGGHPYDASVSFDLNTRFTELDATDSASAFRMIQSRDSAKDVVVDLPPGFVGDPTAVPECPGLRMVEDGSCPPASQVGVASINPPVGTLGRLRMYGVYNVAPGRDHPAEIAFSSPVGIVLIVPTLRSDGDWGLTATVRGVTQADALYESKVTLWGVPADPSHDAQRCVLPNYVAQACVGTDEGATVPSPIDRVLPHGSGAAAKPFLTNPTECSGEPEVVGLHVSSWENPGGFEVDGDADLTDPAWKSASASAPPITGCERLQFAPSIDVRPTTSAPDSPTGLEFELSVPQNDDPRGLATAHLEDTTVVLPEGMTVNPSSAGGLDACTSGQIGLVSKQPVRFTKLEPSCPLASKIGTVEVVTPLLDDPLSGDVFLARQTDNPFDSLLAMYIVVRGPGLMIKLGAHVTADPRTGRLSTTVLENPQLPFSRLSLRIKDGPRAPLTTPAECGTYTTTAAFTSWAGHDVDVSDSFAIDCPGNAGSFDPGFSAGSTQPIAGSFSPFTARITRGGGKELGRINVVLPKGQLAALRDVAVCSDAQIASSTGKAGVVAQGAPSCPAASQIGTTTVGAGSGPTPFYPALPGSTATGRVFLSAPHRGSQYRLAGVPQADYGLAIEVPAVAGPFDLGTVMVRAAIYVDPVTAQITVLSDTLPRILQGIVLDVRDVRVDIDRDRFSTTPSSCAEKQVRGDIVAQDGTTATRSARYQVGECASLRYKPRLALALTGKRQRTTGKHPGVKAIVRQTGLGEAGIKRAEVRLPKSLALDPDNAQALCEFADGTKPDLERHCLKGSIVGRARAVSPLLKRPLVGDVFFVKNVRIDRKTGNRIRTLPMIVVALRGEVDVNLTGKSSVKAGRLVNTFDQVPDAPISQFNLNINGGNTGILVVTATRRGRIDLCTGRHTANVAMNGQNGMRRTFDVAMKTPCKRTKRNRTANKRPAVKRNAQRGGKSPR